MMVLDVPILAMGLKPVVIITLSQQWTDRHLVTWCRWKHGWDGPDGLPERSCAGENYSSVDLDSEIAYDKLDGWIAETVDTCVNDLPPAHKAAVYRCYDIVAVFQFPRGNYAELLKEAKGRIAAGLRRRGVWLGE